MKQRIRSGLRIFGYYTAIGLMLFGYRYLAWSERSPEGSVSFGGPMATARGLIFTAAALTRTLVPSTRIPESSSGPSNFLPARKRRPWLMNGMGSSTS